MTAESISDGCCHPVIDLTYQLSYPERFGSTVIAFATVTSVQVHEGWDPTLPSPKIGDTFILTLTKDVILSSLTVTNYCDIRSGQAGVCGA